MGIQILYGFMTAFVITLKISIFYTNRNLLKQFFSKNIWFIEACL